MNNNTISDTDFIKGWITKNLGDINITQEKNGDYRATLLDVFKTNSSEVLLQQEAPKDTPELNEESDPSDILNSLLNDIFEDEDNEVHFQQVTRVTATGKTEEDSIVALFDEALDRSLEDRPDTESFGVLYKLKLKEGQPKEQLENVIKNGDLCRTIHRSDPEHDHASHKLIDFQVLGVDHLEMTCEEMEFDEHHSHILANG